MSENFKDELTPMLIDAFALDEDEAIELAMMPDMETLKAYLTEILNNLIVHEYERLTNILYRIDLKENTARACFARPSIREAAQCLSGEIVQRMIEKLEYRRKGNA